MAASAACRQLAMGKDKATHSKEVVSRAAASRGSSRRRGARRRSGSRGGRRRSSGSGSRGGSARSCGLGLGNVALAVSKKCAMPTHAHQVLDGAVGVVEAGAEGADDLVAGEAHLDDGVGRALESGASDWVLAENGQQLCSRRTEGRSHANVTRGSGGLSGGSGLSSGSRLGGRLSGGRRGLRRRGRRGGGRLGGGSSRRRSSRGRGGRGDGGLGLPLE
jgi:hypothetical protein